MVQGTSLVVQWLRLCASIAAGEGSIPGRGTKILRAEWRGQKNKSGPNGSTWGFSVWNFVISTWLFLGS